MPGSLGRGVEKCREVLKGVVERGIGVRNKGYAFGLLIVLVGGGV